MKKKTYQVIVNINLEYDFKAKNEDEAETMAQNVELPKEYVEDSFEIVKTYPICDICKYEEDADGRCGCTNQNQK